MHILIVKMSSLGDIIHAFPVLQYLKQSYPDAKIDWAVEQPFAELVQAHPFVHRVLRVQTKKWRSQLFKKETWKEMAALRREVQQYPYDVVLDLQGNTKSSLVTFCAKSAIKVGFGRASVTEWPNLLATNQRYNPPPNGNIREDYLFLAQSAFGNFTPIQDAGVKLVLSIQEKERLKPITEQCQQISGLKILVCPGSIWTNKQLATATLQNFLNNVGKQYSAHFFFIWGSQEEKKIAEGLSVQLPQNSSVIDRLPLPALQNLMTQMDLVMAMDSLPLHLAGTTSTPTYSVFGASAAHKYKPVGTQHEAFQGTCPYGKSFKKRCDLLRTCKTGACIKQLEGQELFEHFSEWWNSGVAKR